MGYDNMPLETNVYVVLIGLFVWSGLTIAWAYWANKRDGLTMEKGIGFFEKKVR